MREEGAGASHYIANEQEEIVRYCQCGAIHLVLPGTGTIKKPTLLAEPQQLIWFTVAMETPDLFTPSAEQVAVGGSKVGKGGML